MNTVTWSKIFLLCCLHAMSITLCVSKIPRTSLGLRTASSASTASSTSSSSKALKKVGGGSTRGGASAVAAAGAADKIMSANTYKVFK